MVLQIYSADINITAVFRGGLVDVGSLINQRMVSNSTIAFPQSYT